jgi:hypothetical protein
VALMYTSLYTLGVTLLAIVSSTADGLRTVAGTLPPFPMGQVHQDEGGGAKVSFWAPPCSRQARASWQLAQVVRAVVSDGLGDVGVGLRGAYPEYCWSWAAMLW